MTKNKKIMITIVGFIAVIIAFGILFALNSTQILRAIGLSKPTPVFSFNQSAAPGWWAAENYNSQASADENYQGDEPIDTLPVASISVFKGKKGEYATACFVMFSYYDYKADVDQLKKDKQAGYSANTSSAKSIGETESTINVFGAAKEFTILNYELIGSEAKNSMKGMSYGWVDLEDGYISVSGTCPTSEKLNDLSSVSGAMSLVKV